jgi:hypothetical protein
MIMSSETMRAAAGTKGRAVEVLHHSNDLLSSLAPDSEIDAAWAQPSSAAPLADEGTGATIFLRQPEEKCRTPVSPIVYYPCSAQTDTVPSSDGPSDRRVAPFRKHVVRNKDINHLHLAVTAYLGPSHEVRQVGRKAKSRKQRMIAMRLMLQVSTITSRHHQ